MVLSRVRLIRVRLVLVNLNPINDTYMFFALCFFDILCFCDDAEEVSLKMPSSPTAAIEAGARGLAERVSKRPFGSCMFFAHRRQPTDGCRRVYRLPGSSFRSGWYRCVHDMHGPYELKKNSDKTTEAELICYPPLGTSE